MENADTVRRRLVRWLLAMSAVHVAAGLLLPWCADAPLLDGYHRGISAAFWPAGAPAEAHALQAWWMALFGPTVQVVGLWMIVLVRLADRLRDARTWRWLIAGLVLWAPQDMLISLRAGAWVHVWIDLAALITLLPPLLWLQRHDKSTSTIASAATPAAVIGSQP